jgi:hypothetical protein
MEMRTKISANRWCAMAQKFERGDYVRETASKQVFVVVKTDTDGSLICQDEEGKEHRIPEEALEAYDWRKQGYKK